MMDNDTDHRATFIILAPHYNPASNGIMLIYRLGELLQELGHLCHYFPLHMQDFLIHRHLYPEFILKAFIQEVVKLPVDSFVIMPEITPPELLKTLPCRYRIWYLMNKPWLLNGQPTVYRPQDAVISYSGLVSKAHFNAFFNRKFTDFDPLSSNHKDKIKKKQNIILIYCGKSRPMKISPSMSAFFKRSGAQVVCIHRHFPSSRDQLYTMLRSARLLISFDPLTNLNYEATLCGTPCYVADNYMGIRYEDYNIPLDGIFEDVDLLGDYYDNGIAPETQQRIFDTYAESTGNHHRVARGMVNHCQQWFALTERAETDPALREFLEVHNRLRLENDLLYFKTCNSTAIDPKLQVFVPSVGWRDWVFHTVERYRWYLYRDFIKYILRLPPQQLATKLHYYKQRRAARFQARVKNQLASLNINTAPFLN